MDSEYEDDEEVIETQKDEPITKISWLLQIALENLGVSVSSYIVSNIPITLNVHIPFTIRRV